MLFIHPSICLGVAAWSKSGPAMFSHWLWFFYPTQSAVANGRLQDIISRGHAEHLWSEAGISLMPSSPGYGTAASCDLLAPSRICWSLGQGAALSVWGNVTPSLPVSVGDNELSRFNEKNAICSNMDGSRDYPTKWSQTKISHDITHMWNLKYDANELIHETETDSQTQRTDLWLPRGREAAKDWEFGISRWRLVYIRWINKVLLYRELYSISCDKW